MADNTHVRGNETAATANHGHHEVTQKDVRTAVSSATIGTSIEWYDFFLYGTAAGLVFNRLYFPADDPLVATILSYATFAVGFIARPLGGLVFGHLGDRIGRKKTLIVTMYIMGIATLLIGAIPTYEQIGIWAPILLTLLRVAQGIAIGGEWGGAVLLSVEYAPKKQRGLYGSFPQMGIAFGLLLGTGAFTALGAVMSEEAFLAWGWRIAFFASLLLVIVGVYLRSRIADTPAFKAARESQDQLEKSIPLAELMKDPLSRRHVLLGMGTRYAEGVSYNLWAVFLLSYLTGDVNMEQHQVLISLMITAVVLGIFIPVWGAVSDRASRRLIFGLGALLLGVSVFPAFGIMGGGSWLFATLVLIVMLGIVHPMMYGPQAAFYAELFPPHTRYTGISIVYQLSGIVAGGLTPIILTSLVGFGGMPLSLTYVIVTCVVTIACVIAIRPSDIARATAGERDVLVTGPVPTVK